MASLAAQQGDLYTVTHPTTLRTAPDTKPLGQLYAGTAVEVLARDHGWVRIHTDGWVREADLAPDDSALRNATERRRSPRRPRRDREAKLYSGLSNFSLCRPPTRYATAWPTKSPICLPGVHGAKTLFCIW